MAPAFWFTLQVKGRRLPIPLVLVLPLALLLDLLGLAVLCAVGIWKKCALFPRLGLGFFLTRLTLALMLWGGRFRIGVNEGQPVVRLHGGWRYR